MSRLFRAFGKFAFGPAHEETNLSVVIAWRVVDLLKTRGDAYSVAPTRVLLRLHPDDLHTLRARSNTPRGGLDGDVQRDVKRIIKEARRPPVRFPPGFTVVPKADASLRPGRPACAPAGWRELKIFPFLAHRDDGSRARPEPRVMLRGEVVVNEKLLRPLAHDDVFVSGYCHATIRVVPDDSVEIIPEAGLYTEVDGRHLEEPVTFPCTPTRHTVLFGQTALTLFWDEGWEPPGPGGM